MGGVTSRVMPGTTSSNVAAHLVGLAAGVTVGDRAQPL